ncbi:hypothetical protein CEXT_730981 [Caerostris extrusa]|uniref:Uncharacterized protein n=1 Tax=Caerostris extrusa TaxID=172846 RepID=A0AAV4MN79_CAEEX|nr:hypothetical protein CEXT_730981 [Caerostris extrusa]
MFTGVRYSLSVQGQKTWGLEKKYKAPKKFVLEDTVSKNILLRSFCDNTGGTDLAFFFNHAKANVEEKGQLKRPKKRNKKTGERENLPDSAVLPQMSNQEKGLPPNSSFDSYLFLLLSGLGFLPLFR